MSARRRTWVRPVARRASETAESTTPLMRWRAPRLSQASHALLALAVAVLVTCLGVTVVAQLTTSNAAVALFGVLWAFIVTSALYAYAEVVIRR